jgi:ketosteroid isomerase-like protein
MSQENVEVVRRMWIAFRDRDWATAFEPVHPNIEMDTTRAPIRGLDRVYKGREEVARFWLEWLEAWGAHHIEDAEFIDAGDQVVVWTTRHTVTGRGSGIDVEIPPYAWVAALSQGKVVRGTMYMDKDEALEAAGLSE